MKTTLDTTSAIIRDFEDLHSAPGLPQIPYASPEPATEPPPTKEPVIPTPPSEPRRTEPYKKPDPLPAPNPDPEREPPERCRNGSLEKESY